MEHSGGKHRIHAGEEIRKLKSA